MLPPRGPRIVKSAAATARSLLLGAVALCAASCASAGGGSAAAGNAGGAVEQEQRPAGGLEVPPGLRDSVAQAETLGVQLHFQQLLTALGSELLRAKVPPPSDPSDRLAGQVITREADNGGRPLPVWDAFFFTGGEAPKVRFRVRLPMEGDEKPSFEELSPPTAPAEAQTLMRARRSAMAALPAQDPTPEAVVFETKNTIMVYLLARATRPDVAVFGQHHRILVSLDGGQVKAIYPLSKSALQVPLPPAGAEHRADKSAPSAGLVVSHTLSDAPTEVHVMLSIKHKVPVMVATRIGNWQVDGGRIRLTSLRN
jgi:hypothetical protein